MVIMNTMTVVLIPFFVVLIGETLALGVAPTSKVTFKKVDFKVIDNPYFGSISSEILSPGDTASVKISIKKDVPTAMMVRFNITFNGDVIKESDGELCEGFKDTTFSKEIIDAGLPKNKFPKSCPIKAFDKYEISKYTFPHYKLPPGLPKGQVVAYIEIYEDGKDPCVFVYVEADVTQQMPGLSGR